MSNMKIIPIIAAEISQQRAEQHLGFAALVRLLDDEIEKVNNKIKQLEKRVDILEHQ